MGAEVGAEIIEIEVMPEHAHLLIEIPPRVALSRLRRLTEGRSWRPLRAEFPQLRPPAALWSLTWFVSTGAPLGAVRRDVEKKVA